MINALTGLGYGIVGLALVIGIGIIILASTAKNVANCPTGYSYNYNGSDYFTDNACCLLSGTSGDCSTAGNYTSASTATQTINTLSGYLGTSSGGLATWIPIVIVLVIGMLFLGSFLSRRGRNA